MFSPFCEPSVVDCSQALMILHAEETLRVVSRPPSTSQRAGQGWRPPRHGGGEPVTALNVTVSPPYFIILTSKPARILQYKAHVGTLKHLIQIF